MALQTLNIIKSWFKTGLKPTQTQFWDTWDSFRHKYEKVSVKDVEGIDELLAEIKPTHIKAGNGITINGYGDINDPYIINSGYPTNGITYTDNPFTAYCFIYPDRGFQYFKDKSSGNEGRSARATYSDSSIKYFLQGDAEWPENNNTELELKFPKPTSSYSTYTIPISFNGQFADTKGNINLNRTFLEKQSEKTENAQFYVKEADGTQSMLNIEKAAYEHTYISDADSGNLNAVKYDRNTLVPSENSIPSSAAVSKAIQENIVIDSQIEVGTHMSIPNSWNKQTIIFTSSCTITIPATLPTNFYFNAITLGQVNVTWSITSPFTFLFDDPGVITEKTYFNFLRRGNTNSIIIGL